MKSVRTNLISLPGQWGFYFDQTRCVNCKTCVLACKNWNENARGDADLNPVLSWLKDERYAEPAEYECLSSGEVANRGEGVNNGEGTRNYTEFGKYHMKENWRRVTTVEYGDIPPQVDVLNLSLSCNQCDHPACAAVCPAGRIYKEPQFGIVLIDLHKTCVSCGRCLAACPWSSPQFYTDVNRYAAGDPRRPVMTKCNLCIDRLRQGLKPACVAACIMRALDAGPLDELKQKHPDWVDRVDNFSPDCVSALGINIGPNIIFKKKTLKI